MKRAFQEIEHSSPPNTLDDSDAAVTSKSRACHECKRHKIKCQRDANQQKCRRCIRQDIQCIYDNTLQKFVEEDTKWKDAATIRINELEATVTDILQRLNLASNGSSSEKTTAPSLPDTKSTTPHVSSVYDILESQPSLMDITREPSQEPPLEEARVVSAPTDTLYEVTKLRNLRSETQGDSAWRSNVLEKDLISRGLLPENEADVLFESFKHTMSQLLWGGIILKHETLASVRASSSLLSSAILTVASIHIPNRSGSRKACYDEFSTLASGSVLRRSCNLDDVRGLCIGAFWLPDLTWRLSGHAVRLATEMGLHQALQKMETGGKVGQREYYERAQLWFLLYVCDHQFATTYGRPPIIQEDDAILNYEKYLKYPTTTPGDVRLMTQVTLFIIHTQIYRRFGTDNNQAIMEHDFPEIRYFNIELDKWRTQWQPRSKDNQFVHSYPSKGVIIHYFFAKFQLHSLSFRAMSTESLNTLTAARKESTTIAISSAMSVLAFILDEPDVRDHIIGIPLFSHTMLAFSAVFLLKVTVKWHFAQNCQNSLPAKVASPATNENSIYINANAVRDLVTRMINLLHSTVASEKHLTRFIASGLSKMMKSFDESMESQRRANQQGPQHTVSQLPSPSQPYQSPLAASTTSSSSRTSAPALPHDGFGGGFNESWQHFPATTMDFLTSQWEGSDYANSNV